VKCIAKSSDIREAWIQRYLFISYQLSAILPPNISIHHDSLHQWIDLPVVVDIPDPWDWRGRFGEDSFPLCLNTPSPKVTVLTYIDDGLQLLKKEPWLFLRKWVEAIQISKKGQTMDVL
jgi:hypothetical protein